MSYEYAQALSQLIAAGLFLCVLAGVAIYVFRPSNRASFERASRLPLESDQPQNK